MIRSPLKPPNIHWNLSFYDFVVHSKSDATRLENAVWIVQLAGLLVVVLALMSFYSLMFASCWLFVTITDDIAQELVAFNIDVDASSGSNHDELMRYFCDIVQLYSDAKQ